MIQTAADQELLLRLLHALQFYASSQLGMDIDAKTRQAYVELPLETKVKVRDAIYERPELITRYADENPDDFDAVDLDVVRQWIGFVKGSFLIERHLKKHSIWIGDDNEVYAVEGITDSMEDIIPKFALPRMVSAVLLPFKGRVVYDGVFFPRAISFGGGIKDSLREQYMKAKQNGTIIDRLDEAQGSELVRPTLAPTKDWTSKIRALEKAASAFQGEKQSLHKEAIAVMKASVELATSALGSDHEDLDQLIAKNNKVIRSVKRFTKALERSDL